ncbi:hypothetical protein D3C80_791800 [compost metagenome]
MLPDVEAQNRGIAVHQRAVLVTAAFHHQGLLRGHAQPGPAAAEAGQRGLGKGFLEAVETAQLFIDGLGQHAFGLATTVGRHDFPEQRMIGVAAALVDHRRPQFFRQLLNGGHQLLHGPLGILGAFNSHVQVIDVGLVMLGVVDLHGLRIDVRLQGIVGVRQGRQGKSHVQWTP